MMHILAFFISLLYASTIFSTPNKKNVSEQYERWILHTLNPTNISLVSFYQQYCLLLKAHYTHGILHISGSQSVLPGFQEKPCSLNVNKNEFEHALKSAISTSNALQEARTIYASWNTTTV